MNEQEFLILIGEKLKKVEQKQEQIYIEISEELTFSDAEFLAFVETKISEGYRQFAQICNELLRIFHKNFKGNKELYAILMDKLTDTAECLAALKEEVELAGI